MAIANAGSVDTDGVKFVINPKVGEVITIVMTVTDGNTSFAEDARNGSIQLEIPKGVSLVSVKLV